MKNRRLIYWACIAACASGWATSKAQTPAQQTPASQPPAHGLTSQWSHNEPPQVFIETEILPADSTTLQSKYALEFESNIRRDYLDSFGPATSLEWIEREQSGGYRAIDSVSIAGRNVIKRAFVDSFRQTAIDSFAPVGDWYSWANDFVVGTVADVSEERLTPTMPVASASEESWWTQMQRENSIAYGIRPFNANPYVYASMAIKNAANEAIVLTDIRCHYDMIRQKVAMEGFILIPLVTNSAVSIGLSYHHDLLNSSDPNDNIEGSAGYSYTFAGGNGNLCGGIFFSNRLGSGIQGSFSYQF